MSDPISDRRGLADWLRDAFADGAAGCPPPEAYLAEEMADLTPEQRQRLDAHADGCPACGAERELARAFDLGEAAAAPEDVAWVVARLRGEEVPAVAPAPASTQRDGIPTPSRVVPFRGRRAMPVWTRLAAAAALTLAAGLTFQRLYDRPPSLPPPPNGGVVRGGEIETLAPAGEVAEPPAELRWQAVPGAAAYRVRLIAVDETPLWDTRTMTPSAPIPPQLAARLHRAVSYNWTVEAVAADGSVLARSAPARFRISPLAEERAPVETTQ